MTAWARVSNPPLSSEPNINAAGPAGLPSSLLGLLRGLDEAIWDFHLYLADDHVRRMDERGDWIAPLFRFELQAQLYSFLRVL